MSTKQKRDRYRNIIADITNDQIIHAIAGIRELAEDAGSTAEITDLEMEEQIYSQMIRYFILDAPDPERENLKNGLVRKLLHITDSLFTRSLSASPHDQLYAYRKRYQQGPLITNQELRDTGNLLHQMDQEHIDEAELRVERIFFTLWMSNQLSDNQLNILKEYLATDSEPGFGTLIVTAIVLHNLEKFSPELWMLLADIYEMQHPQLWQRALIGMMLILIRFDHRMHLYPSISQRLLILSEHEGFTDHFEKTAMQLVRTGDTEKISRRVQEEIIPEMMKLAPKIQEKLSLDQMIQDEAGEDKNPEWEKFFEDSPGIYQKMEELNQLQAEGVDLFVNTFSRLKHYPFFQHITNWFLPYNPVHPAMHQEAPEGELSSLHSFFEVFSKFPVMCNSDKYSFSFNLLGMPEDQRRMIMGALSGEMDEMNKLSASDDLISRTGGEEVFHQYTKDLYRFFRVHPAHNETEDPFAMQRQLYQCRPVKALLLQQTSLARRIGEYYFAHDHFDHAIALFEYAEQEVQENPELFQKLAYAWQFSGNLERALTYYRMAELFDSNALWNLRKIAWCHHLMNNLDEAIKTYREAERLAPDSSQIKLNIGNLLLQQDQWDEALQCYLEAERLNPGNEKLLRPVAWSLFLLGEVDASSIYYDQIMEKAFNHNDLLNYGHVRFVLKDKQGALDLYLRSYLHRNHNHERFLEAYQNDKQHLIRLGLKPHEVAFMLDAVIEKSQQL
jgi:tetratricopeptide (TPR) repeat protein